MPRPATLAAVVAGLALLTGAVAACGGSGDEESPAPATQPAATEQSARETATRAPATEPATAEPAATDTPTPQAAATPAEPEEPEEPAASEEEGDPRLQIITLLPPDAIPAINNPSFITAEEADGQLRLTDLVIGVSIDGEHRAYGAAFLSAHEIVNDTLGGRAIAVTW